MLDYDRLIAEVRLDLDQPDAHAPGMDLILQKAGDVAQLRHSEQQNTGAGWSLRSYDITTQPGQPSYSLGGPEYGKPVRVHTIDPNNSFHATRKLDMTNRQDVDQLWRGETRARAGGAAHTAVAAIPYWEYNQPKLELVPIPNGNARYRIWFETGEIPEPRLGDTLPVNSPFHRYLRISAAIACLRYCWWSRLLGTEAAGVNPLDAMKAMQAYQAQIEDGLLKQEAEFRRAFEDYITTAFQAGTGEPNGYGDWVGDGLDW